MMTDPDRISRGLHTKLPIHVREGLKRLEVPMEAAKFASEGGIILRGHIPFLTRWKDYKAQNEKYFKDYTSKLAERCTTNTSNRGLVRYPQRTGSRSYVAEAHVVKEKQVEGDTTPIDLFKNFHCSKNGYTAPVQAAIEVAGIHPRLKKRTRVGIALQVEEIQANLK
uniref:Uncharacterized protein n=1 Tax=Setaria italica TaxID=4555 RepID=K4A2I4_SETIT